MDKNLQQKLQDNKDEILDLASEAILERVEKRLEQDKSLDLKQVTDEEIEKAVKEIKDRGQGL